jgi:hypothetical protein
MCHCLECQRRTGGVISNQARFRREQVTFAGKATMWREGRKRQRNDLSFLSRISPPPTIAVWEESRHPWVSLPPDTPPKRAAKQG